LTGGGEQTALGRTVAVERKLLGALFLDFIGQLTLEKTGRLSPLDLNQAQISQGTGDAGLPSRKRRLSGFGGHPLRTVGVLMQRSAQDLDQRLKGSQIQSGFKCLFVHRRIIGSPRLNNRMTAAPSLFSRRPVAWLGAAVLALLIAGGALAYGALYGPLHRDSQPRTVRIALGAGPERISASLAAAGLHRPTWQIGLVLRGRGDGARLKAAYYTVEAGLSLAGFLDRVSRGEGQLATFQITEGWSWSQIRQAAALNPDFSGDSRPLSEPELLARIGVDKPSAEGLLWPDTYRFAPGSSELQVYRMAVVAMRTNLEAAWPQRAGGLPFASPYEALILASIIEKETGRDEERAMVAGVFVNRLARGMRLQSDPTTIYALGERFTGRLTRADLKSPLPHNTYVIRGLPPTPIAMPGRASIEAALRPAATGALYFVARGDGSSEFSDDLAAHQRAVNRFIRGQP